MTDPTQPQALYSREAEDALLGAILINPEIMTEIDFDPEDIYIARWRMTYQAAEALQAKGCPPDFVTLTEELDRRGQLETVGGPAALVGLINTTPTSLHAEHYAEIIKDYARRRRTLQAANDLAKAAFAGGNELDKEISAIMDRLSAGAAIKGGATHWAEDLSRLYDQVEERSKNPQDIWGLPTGILDFDRATGGLQPGELLYIGGAPGVGKSILSVQMGLNMAKAGIPGAIYSLEMDREQVVRRAASAEARIATRKLKNGRMEADDWDKLVDMIDAGSEWPLYIFDGGELTTRGLRADLDHKRRKFGIKWFVLDYLMLMGDEGKDDTERSAVLSRRTKNIARSLKLSGISVNSVVKDAMGEDAVPSQRNLSGKSTVVHDADIVAFLTQHIPGTGEVKDKRLRTFTFVKGRELEGLGYFNLLKDDQFPRFYDVVRKDFNASR